MQLSELELAILRYIQEKKPTLDTLIKEFTDDGDEQEELDAALSQLMDNLRYIKVKYRIRSYGFGNGTGISSFIDDDSEFGHVLYVTARGKSFLADHAVSKVTHITADRASAVNYLSPYAQQTISVTEYPQEFHDKIRELNVAIKSKDSNKVKEIFNFLIDKSADVGIALLMRGLPPLS